MYHQQIHSQLFAILDEKNNYFINMDENGKITTGTIMECTKMDIVELEWWIPFFNKFNIPHKVTAIPININYNIRYDKNN